VGDAVLRVSEEERFLEVIMHKSTKPTRQGNSTLRMIRKTILTRGKDTILRLYKSIFRPQLEYCFQACYPYQKQDMEKLEAVQKANKNDLGDSKI